MSKGLSPNFPSLTSLADQVSFTLDTIKDAIKRLSKSGVSSDTEVIASLPRELPMLAMLTYLEALQHETASYHQQNKTDALGLRDRQVVSQAIDLLFIFEVQPRLIPGVGIPFEKRVKSEAADVLQGLRQRNVHSTLWMPSMDTTLEDIIVRVMRVVGQRTSGDVATIIVEKNIADIIAALLQLSFAPLPPAHQGELFLMRGKYQVIADSERRAEMRKRFTRLFDSTSAYVLLETLTGLLNAAVTSKDRPKWFCTLCGRFLTRVLLRPSGPQITLDFIAGNDDDLTTAKLDRIAGLLLTPPSDMPIDRYFESVVPQIAQMLVPVKSKAKVRTDEVDTQAKQLVDCIVDKSSAQERVAHAVVYTMHRLADKDPSVFAKYTEPLTAALQKWFSVRPIETEKDGVDPVLRGIHMANPMNGYREQKKPIIQVVGELLDPSSGQGVLTTPAELQRALIGLQQLILAYGDPPVNVLAKLVVPVFVPLVHWYAFEASVRAEIQVHKQEEGLRVGELLRELIVATLSLMPRSAAVAMVLELVQLTRGAESPTDWPVFAHSADTQQAQLVWRFEASHPKNSNSIGTAIKESDVEEETPWQQDQAHLHIDTLLDVLSDKRLLGGLVGDIFVTLLREQEALMELVRTMDSGDVDGMAKWWVVSQTTMAMVERFGPAVLARRTDILAFILNVLDRYSGDIGHEDGHGEENTEPLDGEDGGNGTEIGTLALMLLGQIMSASEEAAFSALAQKSGIIDRAGSSSPASSSIEWDAESLRLLRSVQGQVKQLGTGGLAVAQLARTVQLQVAMVLALHGATSPRTSEPSAATGEQTATMRFNAALRDVRDDLVPVRAHGLIELRNMVLERSPVVLEDSTRLDATISIFIDMLEDADSFVYLNAIRGLSSLADVHGQRFIPRLVGMYTEGLGTEGLDTQLRAGEALLQSIQRAGAMLAQYADLFVPRLLQMVALDTVRAHSALSILAAAAQTNALALHRWAGEITAALDALLVAEQKKSEAVLRRAAVMFLVSLLRGYGERLLELADTGVLQTVLRALRRVSESDSDELTRMHALVGVEELDEALKSQLFPANPSKSAWSGNYLP